jgi:hypothetical protein
MDIKEKFERLKIITLYPILFGIYPVLALLGQNINEVQPSVGLRPVIYVALASFCVLLACKVIFKDWHRGALSATIIIIFFFTYGHIYLALKTSVVNNFLIGRHRYLLPVGIGLIIFALWWNAKKIKNSRTLTPMLNFVGVFLLIFPVFQTVVYVVNEAKAARQALTEQQALVERMDLPLGYAPDIYYIILDAYGRADILEEMFDYDNTGFLSTLTSKGFYVARCSQSNYGQSMLSITSSLNMNYLDALTEKLTPDSDNRAPLRAFGKRNTIRAFLDSQGYNTVSFATNFPVTEWDDADYYLAPPPIGMNEFEIMLTDTTLARLSLDFSSESSDQLTGEWYRRRVLFLLEQLKDDVLDIPSPKFVFAHLIIPHHPFVFGPNGEEVKESVSNISSVPSFSIYKQGYSDHVTYINKRIDEIIDIILEQSPNPPVIIIQGDHGPAPFDVDRYRMPILNAYYFPDGANGLYQTISPVNTFRVVLNKYFGQQYKIVEDVAYFSEYDVPYDYTIISNECETD